MATIEVGPKLSGSPKPCCCCCCWCRQWLLYASEAKSAAATATSVWLRGEVLLWQPADSGEAAQLPGSRSSALR
jgi:hypothetical protein